MLVLNCDQRSPEWFQAHVGRYTGSQAKKIMTPGTGKIKSGKTGAINYAAEIVAEQIMYRDIGQEMEIGEGFTSEAMQNGIDSEPESVAAYEFLTGNKGYHVGMIIDGDRGISPDLLIDDDGGLEIKNLLPKNHVIALYNGVIPDEHRPQVYMSLVVSNRQWWDFMSRCPGFEPLIVRATREDVYFENAVGALDDFDALIAHVKEKVS